VRAGSHHDPAVRAKMSAASKRALADPAVRAKMSAARKRAWADRDAIEELRHAGSRKVANGHVAVPAARTAIDAFLRRRAERP
jgi:FAD/FMN-containing dehydrogenase